jgi:hypothetical protein
VLDRPFIHRPAWYYIQPALNLDPPTSTDSAVAVD